MKYIHFKNYGIIVFSSKIRHDTISAKFDDEVLGAGFVEMDIVTGGRVCSGYSSSLKIGSSPDDTEKLNDMGIF